MNPTDTESYIDSSLVQRVDLKFMINNCIIPDVVELLNMGCVISGSPLINIILNGYNPSAATAAATADTAATADATVREGGDTFTRRYGSFYKYLSSFKDLVNTVKDNTIDMSRDLDMLLCSHVDAEYEIYTADSNYISMLLIDKGYNIEGGYKYSKYINGALNVISIHYVREDQPIYCAIDAHELSCFKLAYDGKYLYSKTYGSTTSLDDLINKIIRYDNSTITNYSPINKFRNLDTFKMLTTYVAKGFTFTSDDKHARELYARFISTNVYYIHVMMAAKDESVTRIYAKLIREEFFRVFDEQKLLLYTQKLRNTSKFEYYIYDNPYYVQYRTLLLATRQLGLTTLEGVKFIPEHTAFAVNFTTSLNDILPFIVVKSGDTYNYLAWSNIIVRIALILFNNVNSYIHTYGIDTTFAIIDIILDQLNKIDPVIKTSIIRHINANLYIYCDDITPIEVATLYFITLFTGYFGNINNGPEFAVTPTLYEKREIVYDGKYDGTDEPVNDVNSLSLLHRFTDEHYENVDIRNLQHSIRDFEVMNTAEHTTEHTAPSISSIPSINSVRLIVNFRKFNIREYTRLNNIYKFLCKIYHRDIRMIAINMQNNITEAPFWVSMDIDDKSESDVSETMTAPVSGRNITHLV